MTRIDHWLVEDIIRALRADPRGCIVLGEAVRPQTGPARIRADGKHVYLHRYLYEVMEGVELGPKACLLSGGCNTRDCINPYHRIVTAQRGTRIRTHCPNGHRYTDENIVRIGRYRCGICYTDRRTRERGAPDSRGYCRKGHRFTLMNTYVVQRRDGTEERRCRECAKRRQTEYRNRKKES